MKKLYACIVVLLAVSTLIVTLTPNSSAATTDIEILSYSHYIDNLGNIVVVGEVQNTGINIINNVTLVGSITGSDGSQVSSGCIISAAQFLPGQKSSFYMEFNAQSTASQSWYGVDITSIDLSVYDAPVTSQYQYQDLVITSQQADPQEGVYWVNVGLKNDGSEIAKNIMVYGTFYNSSGAVVAVGDIISPIQALAPEATTTIKVPAFDLNQSIIPSSQKISSFRLLVQVQEPLLTGSAPVVDPSTTPVQANPDSSGSVDANVVYGAVIVVAVAAVLVAVFLFKRRKPEENIEESASKAAKPKHTTRRGRQ